jgi:hypothetical protein
MGKLLELRIDFYYPYYYALVQKELSFKKDIDVQSEIQK